MADLYRVLLEHVIAVGDDPEQRALLDQAVIDAGGIPRPWPELLAWSRSELERLASEKEGR